MIKDALFAHRTWWHGHLFPHQHRVYFVCSNCTIKMKNAVTYIPLLICHVSSLLLLFEQPCFFDYKSVMFPVFVYLYIKCARNLTDFWSIGLLWSNHSVFNPFCLQFDFQVQVNNLGTSQKVINTCVFMSKECCFIVKGSNTFWPHSYLTSLSVLWL